MDHLERVNLKGKRKEEFGLLVDRVRFLLYNIPSTIYTTKELRHIMNVAGMNSNKTNVGILTELLKREVDIDVTRKGKKLFISLSKDRINNLL